MDNDHSYFYTDGPSPLHEARDAYKERRQAANEAAAQLVNEVGAESAAGAGCIQGFAFAKKPEPGKWKYVCKDNKGNALYAPKRNSKEGRAIHARMAAIKVPSSDSILKGTGLNIMRFSGRYMLRSTAGWVGDRIFVTIPSAGDGDKFPEIPDYLTPCKRWEFEKFQDEYRAAQEHQ